MIVSSILLVPHSGSLYTNSERYVASTGYSQHLIHFHLRFWISVINLSPLGVPPMCTKRTLTVPGSTSNALEYPPRMVRKKRSRYIYPFRSSLSPLLMRPQVLCREAVVWKRLKHPNIVPFLGVTLSPLQLVSEWMPGGELREYIRSNSDADLLGLVGVSLTVLSRTLTPTRYLVSLVAFIFCTLGPLSMEILTVYVSHLNLMVSKFGSPNFSEFELRDHYLNLVCR